MQSGTLQPENRPLQPENRPSGRAKLYEQIELQAKLLNYFLGSNKSNINQ